MARTFRRSVFYGILLVAGVTLGMQMSEEGAGQPGYIQPGTGLRQNAPIYNSAAGQPLYGTTAAPGYGYVNQDASADGYRAGYTNGYADGSASAYTSQPGSSSYGIDPSLNGQVPAGILQTPGDLLLPQPELPAVDRFADKTANLLQQASRRSIHWFASLFGPSVE